MLKKSLKVISLVVVLILTIGNAPVIRQVNAQTSVQSGISVDGRTIVTGQLTINLDNQGKVTGLIDNLTDVNYAHESQARTLISLVINGVIQSPTAMSYLDNVYTFTFANNIDVEVTADVNEEYVSFEITNIPETEDIETLLWGPFATNIMDNLGETIGIAYNNQFAIGMQCANIKTLGGWPKDVARVIGDDGSWLQPTPRFGYNICAGWPTVWGSVLQAYTRDYSFDRVMAKERYSKFEVNSLPSTVSDTDGKIIGSKIAMFGCGLPSIMDTISAIEIAEGLPHPMIEGQWSKTTTRSTEGYLIMSGVNTSNVANLVDYARRAGFKGIYSEYTFNSMGHFDFKLGNDAYYKENIVDVANSKDINVGVHTLSNFINRNDSYATAPINYDDLSIVRHTTLTQDISASHTGNISVQDGTDFNLEPCFAIIDDELVRLVQGVGNTLVIAERGIQGTVATGHSSGANVRLMPYEYSAYNVVYGGIRLIPELAERMATLFNDVGIRRLSFDGIEGNNRTGYDLYARNKMISDWVNTLNTDTYWVDASELTHYAWHALSYVNWGEVHKPFRNNLTDMRSRTDRNYPYYVRNFFPKMLGWFGLYGDTTVQEMEWLLSKNAAYGTGFALADRTNGILGNPNRETIYDKIREWTTASRVNAFTMEQRERLADLDSEWELNCVEPGIEWELKNRDTNATEQVKAPGIINLATNDWVTFTTSNGSISNSDELNDKDVNTTSFAEISGGAQWIQVDLGQSEAIDQVRLWHYYMDGRRYKDVVVQLSDTPDFSSNVTTVYNNDQDNSLGLGLGTDAEYSETYTGKTIEFDTFNARYVRLWSNGSNENSINHYSEIQVLSGKSSTPPPIGVTVLPKGGNLALQGMATSSNESGASNVNDGVHNTSWTSDLADDEYIYVDLGEPYDLSTVAIKWNNDNAVGYKVRTSNDAKQWFEGIVKTDGNGGVDIIDMSGKSARFVQVLGTARGDSNIPYSIKELEVYKADTTQKVIICKDDIEDPEVIMDGISDNSDNYANLNSGPQWIQIDLGKVEKVNGLNVWHYYNDGRTYNDVVFQLSNDMNFESNVTTVYNNDNDNTLGLGSGSDTSYAESSNGKEVNFNSVGARYVRLHSNGSNINGNSHYVEVEVSIAMSSNVASGKTVTASGTPETSLALVTDGDYDSDNWAGLNESGLQWYQIDLSQSYDLDELKVWRYYSDNRTYKDCIIQVSNDQNFQTGVVTVFNNDQDNSAGFGIGTDSEYAETVDGKTITLSSVNGRYIRLYSNGSDVNGNSHLVEVEVYGR